MNMTVLKEKEIILESDIYFLEVVNKEIIVNNDYEGILVLSPEFKIIKKIDIYQDFCIYNAIVLDDNRILFNCIENNLIVVVNIKTSEIQTCEMPQILANDILMKKVKMDGNNVVIKSFKNHFWNFDIQKMTFGECNNIFFSDDDKRYDSIHHITINDSLVFLNELNIEICEKEESHNIFPQKGYRFLRVSNVCDNHVDKLIVLSGSNDNKLSVLTSYCLK